MRPTTGKLLLAIDLSPWAANSEEFALRENKKEIQQFQTGGS